MKRRILTYLEQIDAFLENPPEDTDWEEAVKTHITQIEFFQHERLIHLIVTVLFALMTTSVVIGFVNCFNIWLAALMVPLLILLFPYISHYYLLENSVQKMYIQYDRMIELKNQGKWIKSLAVQTEDKQ